MGHERIGYLPKTKKWRAIVAEITNFSADENTIDQIASKTTKNLITRYKQIENDNGVFAAINYLILLTYSAKQKNSSEFLCKYGINLPANFNLLTLSKSIKDFISSQSDSREYSAFASHALIETVSEWTKKNAIQQRILFDTSKNSFDEWQTASNGSGFCELSRLFFTNFTENYLKYFLEREASSKINNLFDRSTFNKKLEEHIDIISKHAFETTKITQSFSAGWYNKFVSEGLPPKEKIKGFISYSFGKLNSELIREQEFE